MRDEFKCYSCEGRSIVPPDDFDEKDAVIRCANCGAVHGTLGDLRKIVAANRNIRGAGGTYSGC